MSYRVAKLIKDYPGMLRERDMLVHEIRGFTGMSDTEMIEAMCFHQPDGERVKTSSSHDRMQRIAMSYAEQLERTNKEWLLELYNRFHVLQEEIAVFEHSLRALPEDLRGILWDIVLGDLTWDVIAEKHNVSRSSIGYKRKKAIEILDMLYFRRDKAYAEYMVR